MNANEARQRGFDVAMVPKQEVSAPNLPPINVTVENTGLSELVEHLTPQVIEITKDETVAAAFLEAMQRSNELVLNAVNKIRPNQIVESCDFEHDYDPKSRMAIITKATFNYRENS